MRSFSLVEARSITVVIVVTAGAVFKFKEVIWQLMDLGLSTECTNMSLLLLSFIGIIGMATDLQHRFSQLKNILKKWNVHIYEINTVEKLIFSIRVDYYLSIGNVVGTYGNSSNDSSWLTNFLFSSSCSWTMGWLLSESVDIASSVSSSLAFFDVDDSEE